MKHSECTLIRKFGSFLLSISQEHTQIWNLKDFSCFAAFAMIPVDWMYVLGNRIFILSANQLQIRDTNGKLLSTIHLSFNKSLLINKVEFYKNKLFIKHEKEITIVDLF